MLKPLMKKSSIFIRPRVALNRPTMPLVTNTTCSTRATKEYGWHSKLKNKRKTEALNLKTCALNLEKKGFKFTDTMDFIK